MTVGLHFCLLTKDTDYMPDEQQRREEDQEACSAIAASDGDVVKVVLYCKSCGESWGLHFDYATMILHDCEPGPVLALSSMS